MNVDEILQSLNSEQVDYLLIGGMNFLLRHEPELTFDVDIWVQDQPANLGRLNRALRLLGGEWGRRECEWAPVPEDWRWLESQNVYCLTTRHGALDVFRSVRGLEGQYERCKLESVTSRTATGITFQALSDQDMLKCQEALPQAEKKTRRIEVLRAAIRRAGEAR
jgi:hypothetical protein